jgi:hypothetical protein
VQARQFFPQGLSCQDFTAIRGDLLAKPNYQFEKRQKELAKKNKKEEKRRQKSASGSVADDTSPEGVANSSESTPASNSGADAQL